MATILPLGETTFFDANGDPLAGGTVAFYIPGTTTPKDTYRDADQLILNTNPVVLDSAGRAIIFGSGSYRQVVSDALGNLIWDQVTGEPNAGIVSAGGTSGGTPNAQTLTAGTFDGTDGATIQFTAGLSNTGPMTLAVGGGAPISVLKNGPSGPVELAAGDIVSGNIYSVSYSTVQAAFQLLTSIPPTFAIASETDAEEGENNTDLMTPLRVRQAREQARVDLASAATTDLGSVSSQFVRITGTATISSFGSAGAGTRKVLQFAAALTLTYNATSLQLPSNATNITTVAGDTCEVFSLGSGNWVVTSYQRARPFYVSPQLTASPGGLLQRAHGMGIKPTRCTAYLVCINSNNGWSAGDELGPYNIPQDADEATGMQVWADTTNVYARVSNFRFASLFNKNTGALAGGASTSEWRVVLKAFVD